MSWRAIYSWRTSPTTCWPYWPPFHRHHHECCYRSLKGGMIARPGEGSANPGPTDGRGHRSGHRRLPGGLHVARAPAHAARPRDQDRPGAHGALGGIGWRIRQHLVHAYVGRSINAQRVRPTHRRRRGRPGENAFGFHWLPFRPMGLSGRCAGTSGPGGVPPGPRTAFWHSVPLLVRDLPGVARTAILASTRRSTRSSR